MKKTLSLMLIASLILAPTYRCMANYEFEPENRSMGGLTKMALVLGLTGTYVAYKKAMHWWKKQEAKEVARTEFPETPHNPKNVALSSKTKSVNYALWNQEAPISQLWQHKDAQAIELEVVSGLSLPEIKKAIKIEQSKLERVLDNLKPNTPFNEGVDKMAPVQMDRSGNIRPAYTWTPSELSKYYDHYEDALEEASKQAKASIECGSLSWSKEGSFNALNYVWARAKRLYNWVHKPSLDKEASGMYLARLKQKHRVDTLLAIVEYALEDEETAKKIAQETPKQQQPQPTPAPAPRGGCTPAPAPAAVRPVGDRVKNARKKLNELNNLQEHIKRGSAFAGMVSAATKELREAEQAEQEA